MKLNENNFSTAVIRSLETFHLEKFRLAVPTKSKITQIIQCLCEKFNAIILTNEPVQQLLCALQVKFLNYNEKFHVTKWISGIVTNILKSLFHGGEFQ